MSAKRRKDRPYRRGVGALLLDRRGLVFVARRNDTAGPAWQMPQGGIGKKETPRHAVLRELAEEIGTDKAEIIAEHPKWLRYDLPAPLANAAWRGRYRGQKQRWFALRFTGTDADIDLAAGGHPEFDAWKWVPIDTLPGLIVAFKRSVYEDVVAEFRALAVALPAPA